MTAHSINAIKARARAISTCDVIGDVHGCFDELQDLCASLGMTWNKREHRHYPTPERPVIMVGDLVDRGPRSADVFNIVARWIEAGVGFAVRGNHDDKFMRWCDGRKVRINHGLHRTIHEFESGRFDRTKHEIVDFMRRSMPLFLEIDGGKAVVVHAAWHENMRTFSRGKLRSWALYGPSQSINDNGYPNRIDWQANRTVIGPISSPIIIHGHYAHETMLPRVINRTYGIDTGCVFGGRLTALRYPEMEIVQVDARRAYATSKGWE